MPKKPKPTTHTYFANIVYPREHEEDRRFLVFIQKHMSEYIIIEHQPDVKDDGEEHGKIHTHIMWRHLCRTTAEGVREYFKTDNTFWNRIQSVTSPASYALYMLHQDWKSIEAGKRAYSPQDAERSPVWDKFYTKIEQNENFVQFGERARIGQIIRVNRLHTLVDAFAFFAKERISTDIPDYTLTSMINQEHQRYREITRDDLRFCYVDTDGEVTTVQNALGVDPLAELYLELVHDRKQNKKGQ